MPTKVDWSQFKPADDEPALLPQRELSHAFLRGEPEPGMLGQLGQAATMAFPPTMLAKGLAGGDTYPMSKEGAFDFLRYTSPQDLPKVLAAQGASMREGPRGTVIVTNAKGEDAVLNRPGFSPEDFRGAGVNLAPFLIPVPGAGKIATPMLRAGVQGAVGGMLREAADAAIRPSVGAETNVGGAAKNVAFDAAFSSLLQPLAQAVANFGVDKLGKYVLNKKDIGFSELRKAFDAQKVKVTDTQLAQIQQLMKQTDDPMTALRWLDSQANKMPLSQGGLSGDKTQLDKEARFLSGESGPAKGIMQGLYTDQREALVNRAQDLRKELGADPSVIGENLGASTQPEMLAAREAGYQNVQKLYNEIPDDAQIIPRYLRAKPKGSEASPFEEIRSTAQNYNVTAPTAFKVFTNFRKMVFGNEPIRLKQDWEGVRRQFGDLIAGSDATEAKAAREIRDAMDRAAERVESSGGVTPDAIPQIQAARAANKEWNAKFNGDDIVSTLTERTHRSGSTVPAVDSTTVATKVFGGDPNTIKMTDNFVRDMTALKAQLSPEKWALYRADALNRMVNRIEKSENSSGGFSTRTLDDTMAYLRNNEKRLSAVLEPADFENLHSLARAVKAAGARGKTSPSGGAIQTAKRLIAASVVGVGGEVANMAGMTALPPGVLLGGALTIGSALGNKLANRAAAKGATAAIAPKLSATKPNPYYTLGAPATSLIDFLRMMETQQ